MTIRPSDVVTLGDGTVHWRQPGFGGPSLLGAVIFTVQCARCSVQFGRTLNDLGPHLCDGSRCFFGSPANLRWWQEQDRWEYEERKAGRL